MGATIPQSLRERELRSSKSNPARSPAPSSGGSIPSRVFPTEKPRRDRTASVLHKNRSHGCKSQPAVDRRPRQLRNDWVCIRIHCAHKHGFRLMRIPQGFLAMVGPTLGGWFVDNLSWRHLYWMGVPLLILCLFLVPIGVPSTVKKASLKIDCSEHLWVLFSLALR